MIARLIGVYYFFKSLGCDHMFKLTKTSQWVEIYECDNCFKIHAFISAPLKEKE